VLFNENVLQSVFEKKRANFTHERRTMQAAIVTTVKSAQDVLESWIFYHLHIGFRLVILFFDDPEEANFWNDYFDERVFMLSSLVINSNRF
jgi:hypothetical protein